MIRPLSMEGVSVVLGRRSVVDGLSLNVEAGEWIGLIGPNGAGKTTVLRAAAGQVAYRGELRVGGREVCKLVARELAREVALVPQSPLIPPSLSVADYVMLGRTPHMPWFGSESGSDFEAGARALRRLDLEAFASRPLAALSGGEAQRAVLARAMAQEAQLLLLDEPTSALDIGRQQSVLELVDCLRAELGLTVVAAMHDLTLTGQFADRLVLLSSGRVVADGAPADVLTEWRIGEHYRATVDVVAQTASGPAVIPRRAAGARKAGSWPR